MWHQIGINNQCCNTHKNKWIHFQILPHILAWLSASPVVWCTEVTLDPWLTQSYLQSSCLSKDPTFHTFRPAAPEPWAQPVFSAWKMLLWVGLYLFWSIQAGGSLPSFFSRLMSFLFWCAKNWNKLKTSLFVYLQTWSFNAHVDTNWLYLHSCFAVLSNTFSRGCSHVFLSDIFLCS